MHAYGGWNPEQFADALSTIAATSGYTHDDIAERARVHRSQISRWFTGRHRPSYEALDAFLAAASSEDGIHPEPLAAAAQAAGYPRLAAHYSHPDQPGRYSGEEPTSEYPVAAAIVDITRDLHANSDDLTPDEAEKMLQRVLESVRAQARIATEAERSRIDRKRYRREPYT